MSGARFVHCDGCGRLMLGHRGYPQPHDCPRDSPETRSKTPVSDAGAEAAPENANGVTRPSAAGNGEEGEQ